jgi:hypothetical protein
MQKIRRQNDDERWRNEVRLQEKFEVNRSFILSEKNEVLLF